MRLSFRSFVPTLFALAALPIAVGCASDEDKTGDEDDDFSSREATLLLFEFDGQLTTDNTFNVKQAIEDQMLYTIGHLNGDNSVGRLDAIELTNIETTRLEDEDTNLVKYHAVLPVGWGSKTNLPDSYDLVLPKNLDYDGKNAFTEAYKHDCVDWGAHDVDTGSMWYYYRPDRSSCNLAEEDVVRFTASVTKSELNTTGKYPEYDKVWEDNELSVVAIFGKYEDGATSGDAGISAYNDFVDDVRRKFDNETVEPADVPNNPGVDNPDITVRADLGNGKTLRIHAILVDNVRTAGAEFNARYEELSGEADLIFYNGHAGLGANIRALASKGSFLPGKYQIFFMNGCDTYAYVDNALALKKAEQNPDDPTGSKYLDMMTNIMPSFFRSMSGASQALLDGMLQYDDPMTYEDIFANIDRSEVVVVTGEEDNTYTPQGPIQTWELNDAGSVGKGESVSFDAGELPAGTYTIAIHESPDAPGGDADLYVAFGRDATVDDYDHRPWLDGSNELVEFTLEGPTRVSIMVQGYEYADAETSAFSLSGRQIIE